MQKTLLNEQDQLDIQNLLDDNTVDHLCIFLDVDKKEIRVLIKFITSYKVRFIHQWCDKNDYYFSIHGENHGTIEMIFYKYENI